MRRLGYVVGLGLLFLLSGCVVRSYKLTRDRVDQELNLGNRGFVAGRQPLEEEKERKTTRTTQIVEVELHPPIRFEGAPKEIKAREKISLPEEQETWGNRGYLTQSYTPAIEEPKERTTSQEYTVKEGDTLQKISQKFYGTSKKWYKIYKANADVLKGPDRIYPGQVINIPADASVKSQESLEEIQSNLK